MKEPIVKRLTLTLAVAVAIAACSAPAPHAHEAEIREAFSAWAQHIDTITGDAVVQIRTTLPASDPLSKGAALGMCAHFEVVTLPESIVGLSVNASNGEQLTGCVRDDA